MNDIKTAITDKKYLIKKEKASNLYKTFKSIKSSAIHGQTINFTSEGFNHLLFKNARNIRPISDQIFRFRLLEFAYKVLKISTTYQEYEEILQEIKVRKSGKRLNESRTVKYWGFIAIISGMKIKVLVRLVGEGQLHFWSVIPFWKTTKHGDYKFKNFASGKLEED
jgi:hypothetical protein